MAGRIEANLKQFFATHILFDAAPAPQAAGAAAAAATSQAAPAAAEAAQGAAVMAQ